ncbi:MAG: hypothetical protein GTN64_05650 [Candidatus Latescibacteria bacterium]|nr:hypothetical protein [Candidatus Latescibacterota bacterium]NIO78094.1 hypothetical protein [Candidatus Latescibacterota bacterium]
MKTMLRKIDRLFDFIINMALVFGIAAFIVLIIISLAGCGEEGDNNGNEFFVTGANNDIQVIEVDDGQIILACASLLTREGIDCDDDQVKINCDQCFSAEFREELGEDLSVESCLEILEERKFCI